MRAKPSKRMLQLLAEIVQWGPEGLPGHDITEFFDWRSLRGLEQRLWVKKNVVSGRWAATDEGRKVHAQS